MMMRFLGPVAIAVALSSLPGVRALASVKAEQEPTQSLPDSYKVELDNSYVRVVRVHYDAGAKLPDHTHPAGTTVYVYLNDSDGVVFKHSSGSSRAVTRPPVKAGAIRIATGQEEHHEVENTSKTASDFLRIFLKTASGGSRSMRRMPPDEMEFSNKQLRVTRINIRPGGSALIEAKENPVLRVAVTPGMKEWKVLPQQITQWLEPGQTDKYTVSADSAGGAQVIRIEFLTKPQ